MTDVAALAFDPFAPGLAIDPFPTYRRLRTRAPVHYEQALGTYFVWGHEEARQVLRHPDGDLRFVDFQATRMPDGVDAREQAYCKGLRDFLLAKGGEDHRRVRGAYARHFTPGRVDRLRAKIATRANELIDAFEADGEVEIMESYALPLPLSIISELLAIDAAHAERIAGHLRHFKLAIQFTPLDQAHLGLVNQGFEGLQRCFAEIIAERRRNPGDDLLSQLVAEADAGTLSDGELFAAAWGLYAAGHESTAGFTGTSLVTLLEHPDELALLRESPDLVPSAVEELLRFKGLAHATHRILPEPIELGGHTIPAGTPIVVYFTSANRDERWCPHGEAFDITRERPGEHLAFSDGRHKCAGRHLARATLTAALGALIARLPHLRIEREIEWDTENLPIITPKRLHLAWEVA